MKQKSKKKTSQQKDLEEQISTLKTLFKKGQAQLLYYQGVRLRNPELLPSFYEVIKTLRKHGKKPKTMDPLL